MSKKFNELLETIDATRVTIYEVLDASNIEEARTEFLLATERRPLDPKNFHTPSDLIAMRHPNFRYEKAENLDMATIQDHMIKLLDVLETATSHPGLSSLEANFLSYIATNSLREHTLLFNVFNFRGGNDSEGIVNAIKDCNERLYGKPDPEICKSLIAEKFRAINPSDFDRPEQRLYYEELQKQLSDIFPNGIKSYQIEDFRPKEETVQKFTEIVNQWFEKVFAQIPKQEQFSPQEVCEILNNIIEVEFGSSTKFHAIVDDSVNNLSVSQTKREIRVPLHRANGDYDYETLCRIVIRHELCTHVFRSAASERINVGPFYMGLPGYEAAEEGIANCMERTFAGRYSLGSPLNHYNARVKELVRSGEYNIGGSADHYINIGLAACFGKDFRQVYDICFALDYLISDLTKENAIYTVQKRCFNLVRRAFRGTGVLPCYKDLCYFNGVSQIWRHIEKNIDEPELLMHNLFETGKTDPDNETHQKFWYDLACGDV